MDTTGAWPQLTNKQKVAVGLAVIGVAAVLTVATAGLGGPVACFALGALEGSITGAVTGAASGAAISGGIAFISSGGDLQQTKQAAINGACDGFMSGSITGFITGGMTSNHCFVAGTVVITVAGKKAIEYIREGDLVLSEDPETGDVTYKKVLETYINEATELIHLNIDGEEIVTTPGHPFYVKDEGFVLAEDLCVGATLIDNEGNELHLLIKRWEYLQNAVPVYNFAVEDYHTYFVGDTKILVHNECITVDYNGKKVPVYRGGNELNVRPIDIKINSNGLVKTSHGMSLNVNACKIEKFGKPFKIKSIPEGLKIIQRGCDLGHYEIVPAYEMEVNVFQSLLNMVELIE
jgi:hypothetical protein